MGKEKFDACVNHLFGQKSGSRRKTRIRRCAIAVLGPVGLQLLLLLQLIDDLGSRALGALLLGDSEIGAAESGAGAVAARVYTVASDLAAMAGIAGPLHGRCHFDDRVSAMLFKRAETRRREPISQGQHPLPCQSRSLRCRDELGRECGVVETPESQFDESGVESARR